MFFILIYHYFSLKSAPPPLCFFYLIICLTLYVPAVKVILERQFSEILPHLTGIIYRVDGKLTHHYGWGNSNICLVI